MFVAVELFHPWLSFYDKFYRISSHWINVALIADYLSALALNIMQKCCNISAINYCESSLLYNGILAHSTILPIKSILPIPFAWDCEIPQICSKIRWTTSVVLRVWLSWNERCPYRIGTNSIQHWTLKLSSL